MKNIHLIPTDKPSRLWTNNLKRRLELDEFSSQHPTSIAKNIYITKDSEIKEGDWFVNSSHGITNIYKAKSVVPESIITTCGNGCWIQYSKKIILTTDQDLIKDDVQAIDDEFLEWFVNNSSCEKVEVSYGLLKPFKSTEKGYMIHLPDNGGIVEPKQGEIDKDSIDKFFDSLSDEELKEKWNKYEQCSEQENSVTISEFIKNIKQKTVKEAAEKYANQFIDGRDHFYGFVSGAKWQAQKDKIILEQAINLLKTTTEYEVLDSFKCKVKDLENLKRN
jgi:hypothetical protein